MARLKYGDEPKVGRAFKTFIDIVEILQYPIIYFAESPTLLNYYIVC
jgi:hypothetical protein